MQSVCERTKRGAQAAAAGSNVERGLGDCGGAQAQALSDFGVHGAVRAGASVCLSLSEQATFHSELLIGAAEHWHRLFARPADRPITAS